MRRALRWLLAPVLDHPRSFLGMNLLYFGALALGVALTLVDPSLQRSLLEAVGEALSPTSSLGPVVEAYSQGRLAIAILLTFLVNLFLASLVYITLPSLFVPFAGLATASLRGILWGVLFSPFGGVFDATALPHLLTVLLEGEAYVVAMLGVWLWWWPVVTTPGGRWRAWWNGLLLQGRVYLVVALLLAVAATYEALEVIYLIPHLMAAS